MTEQEAVDLLLHSAALEGSNGPIEDQRNAAIADATAIVQELEFLPLAIMQAGCTIREQRNIGTYLQSLKKSRSRLLDRPIEASLDKSHRSIYSALDVTRPSLSSRTIQLLNILSFLHPSLIPIRLITWPAEHDFCLEPYSLLPRLVEASGIQTLRSLLVIADGWDEEPRPAW